MCALLATEGSTRTPAPEGAHLAVCIQIVDMGIQHSEFYGKDSHKVLFGWELPDEPNPEDNDKPFLVWKRYTLSLSDKANLRKDLESWRGRKFSAEELKGFDLKNVLGKPCQLQVVHNEGKYANVASIMAVMKGTKVPPPVNPLVYFDISEWDEDVFKSLGDNLRNKIMESKEAKERFGGNGRSTQTRGPDLPIADDDSIPF